MGITKNRWNIVTVEDVIDVRDGTHDSPKFIESGIPLVTSKNLRNGIIDFSSCSFISMEDHEKISKRSSVDVGDILLAMIGTIGNPVIVEGNIDFSIKNVALFKFKNSSVFNRYFYYLLNSSLIENQLSENSRGGTQKFVSLGNLRKLKIPLPPLEEQKRIAAILDKADAIRQKRQKAIELADEFLRSVFLDMFGPVVNKDNWPLVTFADVTTIDAPMVDPLDDLYLDMLHIGPDRIEKNTGKLLPALTARDERLISKKFLFNEEYVLYSKIRPYLRKVALPNFTGLCSADMYPVKPAKNMMTREYLWQLLLSDAFTQYTETLPDRANIPKLNRVELASYAFRLPPIQLQNKFTDIYKKHSKSLLQLDKVKIKSEIIFSSLSQQAFSGQL